MLYNIKIKFDNMNEIWKDIEGYDGKYFISNTGKVKNNKGKLRKPGKVRGYLQVCLYKDGKRKNYLVHRLVANAFLENPENLPCINHRDENGFNNFVDNLEYCSVKYNNIYGTRLERVSKTQMNSEKFSTKIKCLDLETNKTTYFPSIREAERQMNISHTTISRSIYKHKSPYKKRYIFSEDK